MTNYAINLLGFEHVVLVIATVVKLYILFFKKEKKKHFL